MSRYTNDNTEIKTWKLGDTKWHGKTDSSSHDSFSYTHCSGNAYHEDEHSATGSKGSWDSEYQPWPQDAPEAPHQSWELESSYYMETDESDTPGAERQWTNWSQIAPSVAKQKGTKDKWNILGKGMDTRKKGAAKGKGENPPTKGKGKTIKSSGKLKEGKPGKSYFGKDAFDKRVQSLRPKTGTSQKATIDFEPDSDEYWAAFWKKADWAGKYPCNKCGRFLNSRVMWHQRWNSYTTQEAAERNEHYSGRKDEENGLVKQNKYYTWYRCDGQEGTEVERFRAIIEGAMGYKRNRNAAPSLTSVFLASESYDKVK